MSHIVGTSLNIFASAYSQSDFFGKLIFLGLFTLSILCWIVLIYKFLTIRQARSFSFAFEAVYEKNKDQFLNLERGQMLPTRQPKGVPLLFLDVFFALKDKTIEVLQRNLFFARQSEQVSEQACLSTDDMALIESYALTAISKGNKALEKHLFVLSTIVTLAPFLGLLGTVWGILITFGELHQGGMASSNSVILGGLSTALATTVLGLVIAIPALVAYNYLKQSIKKLSSDSEDFLYTLLSTVELQYRKSR
jgi:biopolymer transport protein TolQ